MLVSTMYIIILYYHTYHTYTSYILLTHTLYTAYLITCSYNDYVISCYITTYINNLNGTIILFSIIFIKKKDFQQVLSYIALVKFKKEETRLCQN